MTARHLAAAAAVVAAAALLAAIGAAPAAAAAPMVADANADAFLLYSAWSSRNGVIRADCTGTGAARTVDGVAFHASFACEVETNEGTVARVTAKALGPEWLRVTVPAGSGLAPDRALGSLPKGPLEQDSSRAGTALERSAWARANDVDSAFCAGVGPYRDRSKEYSFFTFSCATLDTFASRGPHVVISVSPKGVARVLRTVAP